MRINLFSSNYSISRRREKKMKVNYIFSKKKETDPVPSTADGFIKLDRYANVERRSATGTHVYIV